MRQASYRGVECPHPLKKSRLSSSSSNDSGTKVGIQLPEVELTVSTKKE